MNIEVISSKVFVPSPGSGVGVMGGGELLYDGGWA